MEDYSREVLRIVIAQICQTIGWHSVNLTPLEFMVDLLQEYLQQIAQFTHQHTEILGRTEANLDDLGLTFQSMNINLPELVEYVKNVESVPCIMAVPKLPVHHEDHLNFLKPGSKEVVTRPVHVHEHLPPMEINNGDASVSEKDGLLQDEHVPFNQNRSNGSTDNQISSAFTQMPTELVFKRPIDPSCDNLTMNKRAKIVDDSRPLREIHSVMMTTSGFLSPAREGKLPESRTPVQTRINSPPLEMEPPVICEPKVEKKVKKTTKKNVDDKKTDKENKKKNREKESMKSDNISEGKPKKTPVSKEVSKMKAIKSGIVPPPPTIIPVLSTSPPIIPPITNKEDVDKLSKNSSPKRKSIIPPSDITSQEMDSNIGKLPVEPDKQKINILKKISKPREDKLTESSENNKIKVSRETSSVTYNDGDTGNHHEKDNGDENKRTPQTPDVHLSDMELGNLQSPSSDVYTFDDISPPGTPPSTPKTPDMSVPGANVEQKKKRKERTSKKKDNMKQLNIKDNPHKQTKQIINEPVNTELMERPKTPEGIGNFPPKESNIPPVLPFPFFPPFPTPGLIPHPINHPIFQRFPIQPNRLPNAQSINPVPLLPPFLNPPGLNEKRDDLSLPKSKAYNCEPVVVNNKESRDVEEVFRAESTKAAKNDVICDGRLSPKVSEQLFNNPHNVFAPKAAPVQITTEKMKLDKLEKKSKKHKIEKKDKIKKKKDRKEKHKEKLEKIKEKKEKPEKVKEKKERKDKKKEKDKQNKGVEVLPKLTLKLGTSSKPSPPENPPMKKITIKPLPKKLEESARRESSPELAKISALITRPPKQKNCKVKTEQAVKKNDVKDERDPNDRPVYDVVSTIVDQSGHRVWICPACGNQDDGSPMIGCDDCDAWYHWVCVGMQVPPATNEDWYCRLCIAKKQELHHDRKKRKRKKKVKIAA